VTEEEKLNVLIKEIVQYIIEHSEKNPLLGIERDCALQYAQGIGDRIYQEVILKFHNGKNGEKKNE
jgi:hypothetical protein